MKFNVIFSFFVGFLFFIGCSKKPIVEDGAIIYKTSAEFINGDILTDSVYFSEFGNTSFRTTEYARTGKYSIKLDSSHVYGFSITIENPKEGELIFASVWQRKNAIDGTLMCSMEGKNKRTIRTFKNNPNQNEWFKHSLSVIVGENVDKINFYVFAGGKEAFFDDIKIQRFPKIPELNENQKKNELKIYIPDSSNLKLEDYINHALTGSTITKQDKKYVPAFIITNYDSIPIQMRLKGDWTDHLTSGKISYRIKVKGNHSFMGLKTFSIQHPSTRNYMHEWFMHKLCDKEGLLSTKYDMIPVEINGVNKGVYALEEHFDKQLLESRNRREGPILKLDESAVWAMSYLGSLNQNDSFGKSQPYFRASFVSLFKKGRTLKNPVLKKQFIEGAKLLNLFKNQHETIEDIFDVESLAKFYALLELGNIDHAYAWHNRRFYYNPITQHLELIGYDMIPGQTTTNQLYIYEKLKFKTDAEEMQLTKMTLNNIEFKSYYLKYLKKFSDSSYLESCFNQMDSMIIQKQNMLANEIESYQFDKAFYLNRAKLMRDDYEKVDSAWQVYLSKNPNPQVFINENDYLPNKDTFYLEDISVNAYVHKLDSAKFELELENYHTNNVSIIGYKIKGDTLISLDNEITLNGFVNRDLIPQANIIVNKKPKYIVFKTSNNPDNILTKKVFKWQKPKGITTRMSLAQSFKRNSKFYSVKDSVLTFKNGNYLIDELIYIPKKYKVIIPKNTTINFVNGGGIIANNNFTAVGNKENPIVFKSSDRNNNGITILQANQVKMAYVIADSLNTLHYGNWNLTGGISIYESETEIDNCEIKNNTCEDALNIIRSHFIITNLTIKNTKSDGFDADFCTGSISYSKFENTGNDCIDFSGSVISISDIDILNSGDKGISGGERSALTLKNIKINGAITGVAAKDDTHITGDGINVTNAEFGVAAFQKKAEYDNAFIDLKNVTYKNLQQYGLVDLGSLVVINGQYFYGGMKIDIDKMYARFEKK